MATAIQEDVDIVGLSFLSGAHNALFKRVIELLRERGANDIIVVGGGTVPAADIPYFKAIGVAEIFTSGIPDKAIVATLDGLLRQRQGHKCEQYSNP